MLRLRTRVVQQGLRLRQSRQVVRKRFVSSTKKQDKPVGDAARKKPDVVDRAAATQASRNSGGLGMGTVITSVVLGASGYVGIRLYKDAEFCSMVREKAPSLVDIAGSTFPLPTQRTKLPQPAKKHLFRKGS